MAADDGRYWQPHLARVRLIALWGRAGLHTCFTLSHQWAQVEPATATPSQGERESACMTTWSTSDIYYCLQTVQ